MPKHSRQRFRLLSISAFVFTFLLLSPRLAASSSIEVELHLSPGQVTVDAASATTSERTYQALHDEGLPELPYRVINVLLPQDEELLDYTPVAGPIVVLSQNFMPKIAGALVSNDGAIGRKSPLATWSDDGSSFPSRSVEYLGTGYYHGYAIASFAVFPLRVINGKLELSTDIRLSVETHRAPPSKRVTKRLRKTTNLDAKVKRSLAGLVVNGKEAQSYSFPRSEGVKDFRGFAPTSYPSLEGSAVEYVIITNDSLAASFQRLADWKTAKGVPTVVRTTEWILSHTVNGVDEQETIRNFIIDAYVYWGVEYVLLGGDAEQIAPRLGATLYLGDKVVPADLYFSCLDGDWNADHDEFFGEPGPTADDPDLYSEVFLGRLPAVTNAAANTLIDKIISYETPVDPSYTQKSLMLAEMLFPPDWSIGQSIVLDGAPLSNYVVSLGFDDPKFDLAMLYENYPPYPGSIAETGPAAIDSINSGYNFINHIGHGFRFTMSVGAGSIQNADADLLHNTDRYSNFFLLNCTAVAFTYYCLAEHLLLNPIGGAVSTVGANESAFPLISQFYMNEYYSLLLYSGVRTLGETFTLSRLQRTGVAALSDNADLWTHYIYTLLGDPEMQLWTGPVEPTIVAHASAVGLGQSSLNIGVTDGGGGVAGATVCLSKGTEDYAVGLTNGSGNLSINFTTESPGSISVVVTAPDHARYQGYINASASASAYVSYAGMAVDDDTTGLSSGNGDGTIDAGETIEFNVQLSNGGDIATGNVTMILSTTDTYVTVEDDSASVGVISAGGQLLASDPFRVHFGYQIGDRTPKNFTLTILEDGVVTWTDTFTKLVHAPDLRFVVNRTDDSVYGNNNGIIDDNEEYQLFCEVKNLGTGAANGLTATLTDVSTGFVFTDSIDTYADMGTFESAENDNGFLIREPDASIENNALLVVTDAHGRTWQKTFELRPPSEPVIVFVDPSLGPDRLALVWTAADTSIVAYTVYRSAVSGGPYVRQNADPVRHSTFMNTGLQPTTAYYYVAAGIDSSGNESPFSAEFGGSTNPGQVSGWPIAMTSETVGSPVIGDIDGDQDFEIVQGDDKMYAWHANGVEMIDKDGSSLTWGLLSERGNAFVSSVVLAELDTIPGFDIVAASRDTKEIYAFNFVGDTLSGWPVPIENAMRAGLVAADINNDEQKEIIAIDEKGVLYVFNADGSEYRDGDSNPATHGVFARFPGCTYQYAAPAAADLDNDGMNEIIIGTQGDSVYVLNEDGTSMPGWPRGFGSDVVGNIAVGDVDGNGSNDLELIVFEYDGFSYALHHDGTTLWSRWFANYLYFSPSPALADLDNDGTLEAIIPGKDRNLYAIKSNGSNLSGWPVVYADELWTESSPVVADIDNDGSLDVVLGSETRFINGWNASGNLLPGFPLAVGDAVRATPTIADVDKDGDTDLIVTGWDKSVYVFDFPKMFNPRMAPWASYHGNLYNDGNLLTKLPTSITNVMFNFAITDGGVNLFFGVPDLAGFAFHIDRAEARADGEIAGGFLRVASNVQSRFDGMLDVTDRTAEVGRYYVYRLRVAGDQDHQFISSSVYVPVKQPALGQNYPNPFNPETTIEYYVPDGAPRTASMVVYDVRGARVRTLVQGQVNGGKHKVIWNGRNDNGEKVSTGLYFYLFETGAYRETKKMMLLK